MKENSSSQKLNLQFTARITGSDGTFIEKTVSINNVLPSLEDLDQSTQLGFLRDADILEGAILQARNEVSKNLTEAYMEEGLKKKGLR